MGSRYINMGKNENWWTTASFVHMRKCVTCSHCCMTLWRSGLETEATHSIKMQTLWLHPSQMAFNSPCNFEDDLGNEIEESYCVSLQVPFRRKWLINTHDSSAVILHMCRVGENMCCLMCEFPPAMLNFCSLCILWVEIWWLKFHSPWWFKCNSKMLSTVPNCQRVWCAFWTKYMCYISFVHAQDLVLLSVNSLAMNQQHILNKLSINKNT